MSRRRWVYLVPCLTLACVLTYTRLFLSDLPWPSDSHSCLLAQDTLQAASDSVHEAMLSLLEAQEDELRTVLERHAIDDLGRRFDRLQASLDNLHQVLLLDHMGLEELSNPRTVQWPHSADMRHVDICRYLAGKRVTMIGGEHIYRLHVLLLQHRERAEKRPFPCPYHEFCTHHHVCMSDQHHGEDAPRPRYVKPPTTQELIRTQSAVVNYVVSDTLVSTPNASSWEYTSPFVDPTTGIRLREAHWLPAARKANIVILGRGPLSAPGETYTGNWSFLRHVPDYVDKSRMATISVAFEFEDHDNDDDVTLSQMAPRSLDVLNAAVHLTVSRFLPDLFQLLRAIQREVRPNKGKRLIWSSTWYRLPGRGASRTAFLRSCVRATVQDVHQRMSFLDRRHLLPYHSWSKDILVLQLSTLINADVTHTALREDSWTLLFNVQVYLQNLVLRELLPRYGILFLPLDIPWVEDACACGRGHGYSRDAIAVDLEWTTAIGKVFLTAIEYVLEHLE